MHCTVILSCFVSVSFQHNVRQSPLNFLILMSAGWVIANKIVCLAALALKPEMQRTEASEDCM